MADTPKSCSLKTHDVTFSTDENGIIEIHLSPIRLLEAEEIKAIFQHAGFRVSETGGPCGESYWRTFKLQK